MVEDTKCRDPTEISREGLDYSTVYRILSHSKRRALLEALNQYDQPLALADAAEEVVRHNTETPSDDVDLERVEKCRIALHHRHIPMMADGGFVTINDGVVKLTDEGDQLLNTLHQLEGQNPDFS